jgi:type IV secretory pathway VirB6-like protein
MNLWYQKFGEIFENTRKISQLDTRETKKNSWFTLELGIPFVGSILIVSEGHEYPIVSCILCIYAFYHINMINNFC